MNDPKRFKFDTNEFYVKSAEEMARLFAHAPHVVSATMQFPERCNLKLTKVDSPFPAFPVPEGETLDSYFERVCREGLSKRLATSVEHLRASGLLKRTIPEYQARLEREIECIQPVSYTHLDVYKRQQQMCLRGICTLEPVAVRSFAADVRAWGWK